MKVIRKKNRLQRSLSVGLFLMCVSLTNVAYRMYCDRKWDKRFLRGGSW
jgi:hypothetical protein